MKLTPASRNGTEGGYKSKILYETKIGLFFDEKKISFWEMLFFTIFLVLRVEVVR